VPVVERPDLHLLDNPAWHALSGPHARFAEVYGSARRYRPEFATYSGLPDERDEQIWRDLATLVGPGNDLVLSGASVEPPADWTVTRVGQAVQMVAENAEGAPDAEAITLGLDDVPEIFALIERTQPGPWRPRTVELGTYLGIRREGRLIAMAGERVHPPGWTEVSGVCTDEEFRGQGLASRLVSAIVHRIHDRGEGALLHTATDNAGAIRLYEGLGFRVRRETVFVGLITPAGQSAGDQDRRG
jgi:ribosomal protein S18 acetylase RimI-like enzyme